MNKVSKNNDKSVGLSLDKLPDFSIGLVNYKTFDLTKICLDLLKSHFDSGLLDPKKVDVWVVDNDSKDASTAYLRGLDWIHLIERPATKKEEGFAAHGEGLNLILENIRSDYLFLIHTDTFIYNVEVFAMMLSRMLQGEKIAAVGCLHQINRGNLRLAWRTLNGFFKYHVRRIKIALGFPSRPAKPYIEPYIKSFCALWNVKLMRQNKVRFFAELRIPGYETQDFFKAHGYRILCLPPRLIFRYLDHVEAGTVGLVSGYSADNRRSVRKKNLVQQLLRDNK